jgi:rubredoxin
MTQRYGCPCCGYLTLSEKPPGTFAICAVCFWEDDEVQFKNPTSASGANQVSLLQARENFREYGAVTQDAVGQVRAPMPEEMN